MRRTAHLAAVSLMALATGCASIAGNSPMPADGIVQSPSQAAQRADVNPGYRAGSAAIPTAPTASLNDILSRTDRAPRAATAKEGEDRLRLPAMNEAAVAFGARAGLAHATREINKRLEAQSQQLARTYDFQSLMIQGPSGVMVMPPVIVEAQDSWESFDAGRTLRVADKVYEIVEQSRFSSVAPMWQTYLISNFEEAQMPPDALFPRDAGERARWQGWITEGWRQGERQAEDIFEANLARLNRDFEGMVRYKVLLEEGKVSAPVVAEGNLGTTGTGQDMRENDRAIRITQDPTLQVRNSGWSASVTTETADGGERGAETFDPPAARPAAPAPRRAAPPAPRPAAAAPRQEAPTSGGQGRF